jgi:hypothetical protein
MFPRAKVALIVAAALLVLANISFAQAKKPVFTAKDHELIETYYNHLVGTLAPGSLDRSSFDPNIEKALTVGSHVPMQFGKDLEPLPAKLEGQLSQITGEYGRYKLGRHVVLVKKADLEITDIIRNIAVRDASK